MYKSKTVQRSIKRTSEEKKFSCIYYKYTINGYEKRTVNLGRKDPLKQVVTVNEWAG